MSEVKALFWDVGGVILSNGWDKAERAAAIRRFSLDAEDFEELHEQTFAAFESGQITLNEYLKRTVFYREQPFSLEEFREFMLTRSTENAVTRALLDGITATRRYFLATLNNEGAEINAYRIRTFQLWRNFSAFFSSCYLGTRKPAELIYRRALEITQRAPEECIFIDDRPENLEAPRRLGMQAIQFVDAAQLRAELAARNVEMEAGASSAAVN
jgi:putative hydrolase of the HAD superfamily